MDVRLITPIFGPIKIRKEIATRGVEVRIENKHNATQNTKRAYYQLEEKFLEKGIPAFFESKTGKGIRLLQQNKVREIIEEFKSESNLEVRDRSYKLSVYETMSLFTRQLRFLLSRDAILVQRDKIIFDGNGGFKKEIKLNVKSGYENKNAHLNAKIVIYRGLGYDIYVDEKGNNWEFYIAVYNKYRFEILPEFDILLQHIVQHNRNYVDIFKKLKRLELNTIDEYWKINLVRPHAGVLFDIVLPNEDNRIRNYEEELNKVLNYYKKRDKNRPGILDFINKKMKERPNPPIVITQKRDRDGKTQLSSYLASVLVITPSFPDIETILILLDIKNPQKVLGEIQKTTNPNPRLALTQYEKWREKIISKVRTMPWVKLDDERFVELKFTQENIDGGR